MGDGDQRDSKRTARLDSRELKRLVDASLRDGNAGEPSAPGEPAAARAARGSEPPLTSRTATLDDPLTTSLLAEVARRTHTIEVSPDQIADAQDLAAGDADSSSAAPGDLARDPTGRPARDRR